MLIRFSSVEPDQLISYSSCRAAKFAADGVPEQLHQLDPLLGVVAAGAADVLVEVRAQLRVLEVAGAGVEVDQAAGDALLDQVLDDRIEGRAEDVEAEAASMSGSTAPFTQGVALRAIASDRLQNRLR